jgi:hypothetical protein
VDALNAMGRSNACQMPPLLCQKEKMQLLREIVVAKELAARNWRGEGR